MGVYFNKKVSFVIPCYGSEHTVESVVDEIHEAMEPSGYQYEIILVSDHSPDQVYRVICSLAERDSRIRGAEFTKNFGQHSALMAGYRMARGDIIVSLDDDGQTPANMAPALIQKIEEGYDVVYASYENKQHSKFRNWGSRVNDRMAEWLIGKPRNIKVSSYFAMTRVICEEIIHYQQAFPYILGLVLRSSVSICNVEVEHRERKTGTSGYSLQKLVSLWLNGFTAFSVKPLRIATICGFLFAAAGFMFAIYVVIHKLLFPATPAGYSTLASLLLLIGGILMIMLGMIGEYIGRIYLCISNAPQYVIRETVNLEMEELNGMSDRV